MNAPSIFGKMTLLSANITHNILLRASKFSILAFRLLWLEKLRVRSNYRTRFIIRFLFELQKSYVLFVPVTEYFMTFHRVAGTSGGSLSHIFSSSIICNVIVIDNAIKVLSRSNAIQFIQNLYIFFSTRFINFLNDSICVYLELTYLYLYLTNRIYIQPQCII